MTTRKSKAKLPALKELVEGDRDLMKALMKEALQEVLEKWNGRLPPRER